MKFIKKYWQIILLIILGLTPLIWYKSEYIIAKGDYFPFWFNSLNTFLKDNFVWDSLNAGRISTGPIYSIFGGICYFLQIMHIPVNIIQIIFEVFYFLGAGLSMYFLAYTIYKKEKTVWFIASIFYMFNFVMMTRTLSYSDSWVLVFLPLLLAFYVRIITNLKHEHHSAKNIISFAIISTVLLSFASVNPPSLVAAFFAWFFLFLYYFITEETLRMKIVKNLLILSVIVFFINIWWVFPLLLQSYSLVSGLTAIDLVTDVVNWSWTHSRASFLNLFWLNPGWAWGPFYFPYFKAYSNPILQLFVFIPMIIAFAGLLFREGRHKKNNVYFGIVILFFMFLAKGLHSPLGNINLFLFEYIPGSFLFRTPSSKFSILLVIFLALLIGSSCNSILNLIKRKERKYKDLIQKIFILFITASFIISVFPLFSGDLLFGETKDFPVSAYIRIPDYYYRVSDSINNKVGDFKILLTPDNAPYMSYNWGYHGGDAGVSRLIMKPVLQDPFGYIINSNYKRMSAIIYSKIREGQSRNFVKLLSLLNVAYILQRNDIWTNYSGTEHITPEKAKLFLSSQERIHLEKSFGQLDLYKIDDNDIFPHIYVSVP